MVVDPVIWCTCSLKTWKMPDSHTTSPTAFTNLCSPDSTVETVNRDSRISYYADICPVSQTLPTANPEAFMVPIILPFSVGEDLTLEPTNHPLPPRPHLRLDHILPARLLLLDGIEFGLKVDITQRNQLGLEGDFEEDV